MSKNEENGSEQTIVNHEYAEELLLESEERYRLLCQSLGIGIGYYTLDGKVKAFNEIALKNMGLKESDVVGKSIHDLFPKNEADVYFGRLLSTIQKNNVLEFEDRIILPTGEKWFSSLFSCVKNSIGNVLGVQVTYRDITERKKIEQALSNSLKDSQRRESEISALLKASKAVLQKKEFPDSARTIFDACKELLSATAGYVALLSDDGKENIVLFLDSGGVPCTVDPSLPMPIRGLRAEAYNSGKVAIENDFPQSKWQKFSPKGHVRLKNVLFAPLKIEQRTVGVIGLANKIGGFVNRDAEMAMAFGELASIALVNSKILEIIEENEKELKIHSEHLERIVEERTKKLELSSLYARNLIEASLDPLVTISAKGKITDVNKATELATGCSREELIGSDFSSYFVEPEKAKMGYKRVFAEGVVKDYPLTIKHKNGKIIEVLYNATVYRNASGEIQGVFAAARDITEQKKAEEQAQEASKKLKDSERLAAIGATAGMVGHDIRNPLQAIAGDVYLLREEIKGMPESEEKNSAEESLLGIEKNVDYINKIVADLQDFAKPLNPRAEQTDLKLIIDGLLAKNGLPENVEVSVNVEVKARNVVADSTFISRIMYNLVTNAVQAMPNGGSLTILACKEADDVVISVKDAGVGIPESVKGKLFTPMFTTKAKGQGFGLAVIKRMTESLGGTVSFESEEGKGTTFTIRLPQSPQQKT